MSVALTTKAPQYFLQPFDNGLQRPVTTMELTSIYKNNPKWIGSVIAELRNTTYTTMQSQWLEEVCR